MKGMRRLGKALVRDSDPPAPRPPPPLIQVVPALSRPPQRLRVKPYLLLPRLELRRNGVLR